MLFDPGRRYRRKLLHDLFPRQRRKGRSTLAQHLVISLFTSSPGHEHSYRVGWEGELPYYPGVERRGDMRMSGGNRAIMEHIRDRKELHLFEMLRDGHAEYGKIHFSSSVCTVSFCRFVHETKRHL